MHQAFKFLRVQQGLESTSYNGKSDPPPPPDYRGAAIEQGQANAEAARITGRMNRPDEYNPFGSRVWTDLGGDRFRADTTFTPEGQALFDQDMAVKKQISDLGTGAANNVAAQINQPFDISGAGRDKVAQAYYDRLMRFQEPQFERQTDKVRTDLVNRGFSVGNEGYTNAMNDEANRQDMFRMDAADRAATTGAQQTISEALLQRNQPMTELNAIRTGAMPQTPQFQPYAGAGQVAPAPIAAAVGQQGQYATDVYNAQAGQDNAMLGAIGTIGAAGLASYLAPAAVMF